MHELTQCHFSTVPPRLAAAIFLLLISFFLLSRLPYLQFHPPSAFDRLSDNKYNRLTR
jgi:hypothetical protein